jgi:hypothetical protein
MHPIVESPRARRLERNRAKKLKKVAVVKKETPATQNTKQIEQNVLRLKKLEEQIAKIQHNRLLLERQKQALSIEFAKQQSAFISMLPSVNEKKPQQSILLALSSKSMDDFVHGEVMLNFLNNYVIKRNQTYVNLAQSISKTNFYMESCLKTEQDLIKQWQVERAQINAMCNR